jgi:ATP-dependent RNA helicase DDX52/ROK1
VPEWILKLPKPSKLKHKAMGKVKQAEVVNPACRIERNNVIKKQQGDNFLFVTTQINGTPVT